jgi:RimJ/RimL family protein N-acetyltransferase
MLRRATEGEIPAVAALIAAHPLALLQQSEEWLRDLAEAEGVLVWDRDGVAGFATLEWAYPEVVYLFNLGVAETGRGAGRALIRAVQDHVFGTMGAHRLACDVVVDNPAALRVFEGAGFVREGMMRECWQREPGVWVDCHALSMLAREWRARG